MVESSYKDKILFDGKHVQLLYCPRGGEACFATFSSINSYSGFGWNFFSSRNKSAIHFISKGNHWWQPEEVRHAAHIASGQLETDGYKEIITYGSSMGAFGAAAYSGLLKATAAVLLGPQYTVDPLKYPFEKRWLSDTSQIEFLFDDMGEYLVNTTSYFLFYDPRSQDKEHAQLYSASQSCRLIPVPFGGHACGHVLSQSGLLESVLNQIADGTFSKMRYLKAFHAARRNSSDYWVVLGNFAALSKRTALAIKFFEKAFLLEPNRVHYAIVLAGQYLKQGEIELAIEWSIKAINTTPKSLPPRHQLASLYMQSRRFEEARQVILDALTISPNDDKLTRRLAAIETNLARQRVTRFR